MAERCISAYASGFTREECLEKILSKINAEGRKPILLLFASESMIFTWASEEISKAFPDSVCMGVSTGISITDKNCGLKGISALAVFEGIEVSADVILDVTSYPMKHAGRVRSALDALSSFENTVCMEFTTSMANCEEIVLDTFRSELESRNISVFGSSSSAPADGLMTYVSLNGKVYSEGCVFALIHNLNGRVLLYKENMYRPTRNFFTATDVDCEDRKVYEFNNRPAVVVLSEALDVPAPELEKQFDSHPLGRMIQDDILITDACEITEDGAISYYARIYNHTKMVLLEPDNIYEVWERTRNDIINSGIKAEFGFVVNCWTRSKVFMNQCIFDEFVDSVNEICPCFMGCSGLGEQMDYEHLNQTCVFALFE